MPEKVGIGVIGLGMGRYHLTNYANCPNAQIVAISDVSQERLNSCQKEFSVPRTFTNYEEMLELEGIDAVSICTPNYLHHPMTVHALRAGKHVMCEKPMALNAAQAREMVQEAKKAGRKLMIHFNQRYAPESRFLKDYIDSGELGRIYYAKTGWLRRRGIPQFGWFTTKSQSGGGVLVDLGVHMLDLALWYMGYPKVRSVLGSTYSEFGPERVQGTGFTFDVDDLASALITLENGATLFLETSWASNVDTEVIYTSLFGTKKGAERRVSQGSTLTIYADENGTPINITPKAISGRHENPQEDFVKCILEDREPMASGEHGLRVMEVLDAIGESSRHGRGVDVSAP